MRGEPLPSHVAAPDPARYLSDNYVVLDFETDTSHGDYGHARHPDNGLLLACFRHGPAHEWTKIWGDTGVHAVWGNELEQGELLDRIAEADFVVAHNAKYELGWLKRIGVDLRKVLVFDTQLAEYVLLGNLAAGNSELGVPPRSTSLDACCRRRDMSIKDPVVDIMIKTGVNPVRIPRPWLEGRCRQDVETTEQLFLSQRKFLHDTNRLPVLYTRCLLTPVLADIEFEGMKLDAEKVERVYKEHQEQLAQLQREMDELTGGINWRSGKQVGEFIYDKLGFTELRRGRSRDPKRTPGGARLTDQKTLAALTATTDDQRRFLDLRKRIGKVSAALSKALEFYIGVVRERGGVFYADLSQTNTATHRLASTGVPLAFEMFEGDKKSAQFQNQPRAFKELFCAKRDGYLLVDPDGSGLEFRVAGTLGNDAQIALDIESGHDPHKFTASVLYKVAYDEVETKGANSQRQKAKPNTFKPLYGGSKGTADEERYFAAFRQRYAGLARTQRDWINEALTTKRLITPWGLRYYFPTIKMSNSGYVNAGNQVSNYPIQAFATAEIMPVALVYLWHYIGADGLDEYIRIVNFVHDSTPAEVHPDYLDTFKELVREAFTTEVYGYMEDVYGMTITVPLGVGIKAGTHWGTGEEEAYTIWPDGQVRQEK